MTEDERMFVSLALACRSMGIRPVDFKSAVAIFKATREFDRSMSEIVPAPALPVGDMGRNVPKSSL